MDKFLFLNIKEFAFDAVNNLVFEKTQKLTRIFVKMDSLGNCNSSNHMPLILLKFVRQTVLRFKTMTKIVNPGCEPGDSSCS